MIILVLNRGSSTLKLDFIEAQRDSETRFTFSRLAHETVDSKQQITQDNFSNVVSKFQKTTSKKIDVVGHRVVHGGSQFVFPTLLNDEVIQSIEALRELAPLHNEGALQGIRMARGLFPPEIPMVAVFDTAFHHELPPHAATYALPQNLIKRHKIKRYGFHGIAHASMLERYAEMTQTTKENATIITLQLGNGCSICAIKNGKSIDTSMGFTPLEGLVMGTRSGDLDPSLVAYLVEREKLPVNEVERILNEESGLLGVSERSSDMRDLIGNDARESRLAVDLFCYRAKKYVGAYLAALGGAEAIVFGGGIGEHVPLIRAKICEGMEWLGLKIQPTENEKMIGREGKISSPDSKISAYVISVDEAILIAAEASTTIRRGRRPIGR